MQPRRYEEIDGDELLWRRLTSPDWITPTDDGGKRVSSGAFRGRSNEDQLSVHIAALTTLEQIFSTPPYCDAVGEIVARDFQSLGRLVSHTPDLENNDYSHASVALSSNKGQRKKDAAAVSKKAKLIERGDTA
ncbi:MAG: hypothetical protein M3R52_03165 [Acidobacteriota bacterium]|nr:hypothetical protein [Acidobacteriota bacterium]